MVWISWPIYFQQRSQSLEMIQVSTIRVYRFKPAIVLSAIVVEMDIEQVAVMVMPDLGLLPWLSRSKSTSPPCDGPITSYRTTTCTVRTKAMSLKRVWQSSVWWMGKIDSTLGLSLTETCTFELLCHVTIRAYKSSIFLERGNQLHH